MFFPRVYQGSGGKSSKPTHFSHTHTHANLVLSWSLAVVLCVLCYYSTVHSQCSFLLKLNLKSLGISPAFASLWIFARSSSVCQNTYQKQHEVWLHRKRHIITFLWRSIYITQHLLASTGGGCLLSDGPRSSASVQIYFPEKKCGNSHRVCELF